MNRVIPTIDWRLVLLGMGALLCTAALFDLSLSLPRARFRHVLVFDITQSMNVADMRDAEDSQTRLEFAKASALRALRALPCGATIGLGVFTGHRTLLLLAPVETCAHFGELSEIIEGIDWRMAWEARSEVSKGLFSAIDVTAQVAAGATLVFVSDGHEAPPLSLEYPPAFQGVAGETRGIIAGVGGLSAAPIPKLDPAGNSLGYFGAGEVMQIDVFSAGRQTSVADESLAGADASGLQERIARGTEHLSSLKENHLQALAVKLGLGYQRLASADDLAKVLRDPALATRARILTDVRFVAALLACICLALVYLPGHRSRG